MSTPTQGAAVAGYAVDEEVPALFKAPMVGASRGRHRIRTTARRAGEPRPVASGRQARYPSSTTRWLS